MRYQINNWDSKDETQDHQVLQIMRKVKVKSSMAESLPVENLLPQNVGSIINYLQ